MKPLHPTSVPSNADRPATQLLHDEPNTRIVAFHLQPGQAVKAHSSPSTVLLQVVEGTGDFTGDDGEVRLQAGEAVVYSPGEVHAIRAMEQTLRFIAVITPRPA